MGALHGCLVTVVACLAGTNATAPAAPLPGTTTASTAFDSVPSGQVIATATLPYATYVLNSPDGDAALLNVSNVTETVLRENDTGHLTFVYSIAVPLASQLVRFSAAGFGGTDIIAAGYATTEPGLVGTPVPTGDLRPQSLSRTADGDAVDFTQWTTPGVYDAAPLIIRTTATDYQSAPLTVEYIGQPSPFLGGPAPDSDIAAQIAGFAPLSATTPEPPATVLSLLLIPLLRRRHP